MTNPIKESWEWLKSQFTEDADIYDYDYYKKGGEVKAKNTIVDKIGYSEESADYLIQQSPKFAVWLADSILKHELQLSSGISKEEYLQKPYNVANKANLLRINYGNGIRTILDWLQHPATEPQNLRQLTYQEAFEKANLWHDELEALGGDIDYVEPIENQILLEYAPNNEGTEYYWVLIPSSYCGIESDRMGHCGRTNSGNVLMSLRSKSPYGKGHYINESHVTVAYDVSDGKITQAKGKKNQKPALKYHPYLFDLVMFLAREENKNDYINGFNGFSGEYQSNEDYGWEDMSKGEIESLYEINPETFNNFSGQIILYDNKIIDTRPSTTIENRFDLDDLSGMVNLSRDVRDDFIEWVLGGDIDFDNYDSWDWYYRNAADYLDELNEKNYESVIDKIAEITELDKELIKENGAEYYITGEDENFDEDLFDDIRRSIARAYSDAESSGYYKYYRKQIQDALEKLGTVYELNDVGATMEIDLADNLSYAEIQSYIDNLGSDDLLGVFREALYDGSIEKGDLYVDERYTPYVSTWDFNAYFDINSYARGGKTKTLLAPNGKPSNLTPEQYKLVRTPEFKAWFGDWENDPENASKVVDENGEPKQVYHGSRSQVQFAISVFDIEEKDGVWFTSDYGTALWFSGGSVPKLIFEKIKMPNYINKNSELHDLIEFYKEHLDPSANIETNKYDDGSKMYRLNTYQNSLSSPLGKDVKSAQKKLYEDIVDAIKYVNNKKNKRIVYAVFLNLKNPHRIDAKGNDYWKTPFEGSITDATSVMYEIKSRGKNDGIIIKNTIEGTDAYYRKVSDTYIAFEPTQIKLADGTNTTFDTNNPDIRYAKGGKTSKAKSKNLKEQWSAYDRLAQKVAKNYEGKKVKKPYQKKYGKTYDAQEALQVGYAVATKVMGRPKKMALGGEIKVYDKEPNPFSGSMKYANAYTTDDMQDALNYIDRKGGNGEKYYIVKYTLSDGQILYRVRENMLL